MGQKRRVVIEGASGYSGMELTRLLARHPGIETVAVTSGRWAGTTVRDRLGLAGPAGALVYQRSDGLEEVEAEAVLFCTPADASVELGARWLGRGPRLIDLSNAFRNDSAWVYGLTEHKRAELEGAQNVANPGCYPTAVQLALLPLLDAGLLAPGPIVIDAKSGVTGAGRTLSDPLLFNEMGDNHYPYKVGTHQHVPEIERGLAREVLFTPHLLPVLRGLLVSAYAPVAPGTRAEDLEACLRERYREEPFVRVVSPDAALGLRNVVGTPNCLVAVGPAIKGGIAQVFGSEDNLLKGAASQAVQNLNRVLGLPETEGLL